MVVSTAKGQINTGLARATNPAEWVQRLPMGQNRVLTLTQDTDLYLRILGWVARRHDINRKGDGYLQIVTDCSHRESE
jgi:hypothetical protein